MSGKTLDWLRSRRLYGHLPSLEIRVIVEDYGAWRLSSKFGASSPEDRRFKSHLSCHVQSRFKDFGGPRHKP